MCPRFTTGASRSLPRTGHFFLLGCSSQIAKASDPTAWWWAAMVAGVAPHSMIIDIHIDIFVDVLIDLTRMFDVNVDLLRACQHCSSCVVSIDFLFAQPPFVCLFALLT